ncbi:cell envelope integrity protein TolA [Rhizobium tropici]|uniref:Cell envelope integrity protein TolA n=1 Tax=Rhizobium tropici TaxID=398 RepID=A0A5B0W7I0_RHITR|nr:cell envelope integrity protein TolA [Rhizobium tropici]KAA1182355.1 cell envelope integrity protein TolA [Rhizobium tropici]
MREMQPSMSHCRRFGLSLLAALGMMLAGSASVQAASPTQPHENSTRDSIRDDVARNWNIVPGMEGAKHVHVQVHLKLSRSGEIVGEPKVTVTGGPKATQQAIAASAMRAVLRTAPFKNLPTDQYDDWKEVTLNFGPVL